MKNILITGGLGFIGSNFVLAYLKDRPQDRVIILDAETYAARPEYIKSEIREHGVKLAKISIRNSDDVDAVFAQYEIHDVVHFAAESHVCNSIKGPKLFWETNTLGTFNVINAFYRYKCPGRFLHISTDEVFGELTPDCPPFNESTPLAPRSPYAASKAASDLVVQSFVETYGVDAVIANSSNNFGPNQHLEKLIPKTIDAILNQHPVTVYGTGQQVRDWIFVEDACRAFISILQRGKKGERYCVGGEFERSNLEIIEFVHRCILKALPCHLELSFMFTDDRPTDDLRYAINTQKLRSLGWEPTQDREFNFIKTIRWYCSELKGILV